MKHLKRLPSDPLVEASQAFLELWLQLQDCHAADLRSPDPSSPTKFRRSPHPVWSYFERVDSFDAVCLLCNLRVRSACSTNLSRHISRHHPETVHAIRLCWKTNTRKRRSGDSDDSSPDKVTISCKTPSNLGFVATVPREELDSVCSIEGADRRCVGVSRRRSLAGMNSMEGDAPACPVAIHPYGLGPLGSSSGPLMGSMGPDLAGLGLSQSLTLSNIDIANSWCQFPTTYPDLRHMDNNSYEAEVALGYPDLSTAHKFEQMKYEYNTKQFEDARLYHKEAETVAVLNAIKEEEDDKGLPSDDSRMDQTPAKRGRPTENPCWNYFIRLDDQNVRCRICSKIVKSACATNMTKHLERHHQPDYQHLLVAIKQYRSTKGPMPGQGSPLQQQQQQQTCILPTTNHFVKSEPYTDIYPTHFDSEQVLRNFNTYERNDGWSRSAWNQWPTAQEASTSAADMTRTGGVILHGSMAAAHQWNSVPGPSVPTSIEKPYMKRNRKTEHPVWEYFKRTSDGNAQCAICQGVVKSPCSSNFMRHLMRHHSTEYNNVYVKWVQKRGPTK